MIVVFSYGSRTASLASWSTGMGREVRDLELSLNLGQPAIVGATSTVLGTQQPRNSIRKADLTLSAANWVSQVVIAAVES